MAQYPAATPSFTTKQDGTDYPQAAHINDIQAEVTAIGDALRTGLAHGLSVAVGGFDASTGGFRIAGHSTLVGNLQHTGDSTHTGNATLTGNQQVTGNSTFTGDVTITGTVSVAGSVLGGRTPCARVSIQASSVSWANSATFAGLNWTTNDYDSTGLHSTSANSSRINLTSSGMWLFGGQVQMEMVNSTGRHSIRVLATDNQALMSFDRNGFTEVSNVPLTLPVSGLFYATDTAAYLTVQLRYIGGGASAVYGSTGGSSGLGPTHFWVQKVSG
jgi:hypothetical protein